MSKYIARNNHFLGKLTVASDCFKKKLLKRINNFEISKLLLEIPEERNIRCLLSNVQCDSNPFHALLINHLNNSLRE